MKQCTLLEFKKKFLMQKEEIQKKLETPEEELDVEGDEIDIASVNVLGKVVQGLIKRQLDQLRRINAALQRIQDGTFGECEMCGELIGEKRLLAKPDANTCILCAEMLERKSKQYA